MAQNIPNPDLQEVDEDPRGEDQTVSKKLPDRREMSISVKLHPKHGGSRNPGGKSSAQAQQLLHPNRQIHAES